MKRALHVVCVVAVLLLSGSPLFSQPRQPAAGRTPTDRGIDVFLFGPTRAPAGSVLELGVVALGYPTAGTTAPLPGAAISASWDPESFGEPQATAPATVDAIANAEGVAVLKVPVPQDVQTLKLLVEVRAGGKQRVEEVEIKTESPERLDMVVSETQVVPGGAISAWILTRKSVADTPIPGRKVRVELKEGAAVRFAADVTTDRAGSAMVRVPIPRSELPDVAWVLEASAAPNVTDKTSLHPREELPQKPSLAVSAELPTVVSGGRASVRARLLDAGGEPVFGHAVLVWSGPRGTAPPADPESFAKVATRVVTDGAGELVFAATAPKVVSRRGSDVGFVVRTDIEGQALEATARVSVGRERGAIDLVPEDGSLVPGIAQRILFRATGEDDRPLVGAFSLEADGLSTKVSTNDKGEAELTWTPPRDVGAARGSGPCAGGVAAAVKVRAIGDVATSSARAFSGELVGADGLPVCVPVDRDATFDLRTSRTVVRAGEEVDVELVGALPRSAEGNAIGYALSASGAPTRVGWFDKGSRRATVRVPEEASGRVDLAVSIPRARDVAVGASASVLVLPRAIPSLQVSPPTGRLAPRGQARVEARLRDDAGKPITGSVALVMIDKFGGGDFAELRRFDAQRSLCASIGTPSDRCADVLRTDAAGDAMRRALLAGQKASTSPLRDPAATLKQSLDETFKTVLASLEGAVFEASADPETAANVRRKANGKFQFNPELMTLVTETMTTPPVLPSGESVTLEDMVAIDGQISYDNVARRLTRLKLFDVLSAARTYRMDARLDPDEPILSDPNVFLRKLVKDGNLDARTLADPWGGTISFYKTQGTAVPFLTVTKGFELRSPGPDGKLGSGDDVKSPFERVLASKTPYAEAVDEDRIVDARLDMQVADATVASWSTLMHEATGTTWGGTIGDAYGAGGLGLSGVGEGGGGRGYGIGLGKVGTIGHGAGRWTSAMPTGVAHFAPPTRTDDGGKVVFDVPLGSVETTWEIALIGIPDTGRLAVETVDVPSTLPISAKVAMGTRLVVGDKIDASIALRNRTANEVVARVSPTAARALALDPKAAVREVRVPARGAATVTVPVVARAVGTGELVIETTAPGVVADKVTHAIEVVPAGERIDTVRIKYLTEPTDLGPDLVRPGLVAEGPATLVLERGERETFAAALTAIDPDSIDDPTVLDDAVAIANLVRDYAVSLGDRELEARANRTLAFAEGKRSGWRASQGGEKPARGGKTPLLTANDVCPSTAAESAPLWLAANTLQAEPDAGGGSTLPCWTSYVAATTTRLLDDTDEASIAAGLLALDARAHRRAEAKSLRDHLLGRAKPTASGRITLARGDRATKSLVYAALVASDPRTTGPTPASDYLPWLLVQRDKRGSFGSVAATRAALVALTAATRAVKGEAPLAVSVEVDGETRTLSVPANGRTSLSLPAGATTVMVDAGEGRPVFARVERGFVRPWSRPADKTDAPLSLAVTWPVAKRGEVQSLKVEVKPSARASELGDGWASARVRIPLPPGVVLADAVPGVRLFRGVLHITPRKVGAPDTLFVPLRFRLAGTVTVPEATIELVGIERPKGTDRARPLVVAP